MRLRVERGSIERNSANVISKKSGYTLWLVLICSLELISCSVNNRPKVSPDVDSKAGKKFFVQTYLSSLAVVGCDTGKKIQDVPGPLKDYREKMKSRYERFLDSSGYKGEKKVLEQCSSIDAINRFFDVFWSIRDPDTSTPENENRKLIEDRVNDIENEILFRDPYVPGILFSHNGSLRGDMAHVYMYRGDPQYKVKTLRTSRLSDLMAWVYFDENQRPMYVFLFYNKGFGYKLFRNYRGMNTDSTTMETLRELAKINPTSDDDYSMLYQELVDNDQEYIFRFAISRFSYYGDINIDKVLSPPTPESMTAKAIQPKILGVPDISKDTKMIMSEYFTKITGFSRLTESPSGEYGLRLTISVAGIDWENLGENLKSNFDVDVSITNEKTREKKYFSSGLVLHTPTDKHSKLYFIIDLGDIKNQTDGMEGTTLSDLFKTLTPGSYEVKIVLLNVVTLKSGIWYEYITINK